jgi:hypothetical protein
MWSLSDDGIESVASVFDIKNTTAHYLALRLLFVISHFFARLRLHAIRNIATSIPTSTQSNTNIPDPHRAPSMVSTSETASHGSSHIAIHFGLSDTAIFVAARPHEQSCCSVHQLRSGQCPFVIEKKDESQQPQAQAQAQAQVEAEPMMCVACQIAAILFEVNFVYC